MPQLACNVCFASAAALLIQISHTYEQLWFVSLFALAPFLWRAVSIPVLRSAELGCLLAVFLWTSALLSPQHHATAAPLLQLAVGSGVFIAYAVVVNGIGRWLGSNVVVIAVLWPPVELTLRLVNLPVIVRIEHLEAGNPFLTLASLFGVVVVSFLVVLINALLLSTLKRLYRSTSGIRWRSRNMITTLIFSPHSIILPCDLVHLPYRRGPPWLLHGPAII